MKRISVMFFAVLLVIATTLCQAQVNTSIVGAVLDQAGAVIVGARVTVTNPATGLTRATESNGAGNFTLSPLQPGTYNLTVEQAGFEKKVIAGIVLQVDQTARYDITLAIGEVSSEVQVTADAPLLNTDTASVGDVVQHARVTQLPLNGRQFLQLALLAPGTSVSMSGTSDAPIVQTGPLLNINGSRPTHNAFSLDGVTTTDYYYSHLTNATSVEFIQEFKIISGVYSAEYGFKDGGHVSVATRSGTNRFRGSVFEFLRNDKLDAKNFFDPASRRIPPYRQNQFGFALGGPIVKNKTQFFVNYEGMRVRQAITKTASVPTQAMRQGNFQGLPAIYDPLTTSPAAPFNRQPFLNNIIPPERINNAAKVLMSVLPLPNLPGTANNLVSTPNMVQDNDQVNVRVDHSFSPQDSLFGRFSWADIDALNPFGAQGTTSVPGSPVITNTYSRNAAISYVHVVRPNMVNEALVGFNRVSGGFRTTNQDLDLTAKAGIQRLTNLPPDIRGIPSISTTVFSAYGDQSFTQQRVDNSYQYRDTLRINRGTHNVSVGGEFQREQFNKGGDLFQRGTLSFTGLYSSPSFNAAAGGNGFADFLLGYPRSGTAALGSPLENARSSWFAVFVQDDWRARRNLTLNLGLRYEYKGPYTDTGNRLSNFDFERKQLVVSCESDGKFAGEANFAQNASTFPFPIVCNQKAGWNRALVTADWKNFSPRIGFAYSPPASNWVVRAGYGLFWGLLPLNNQGFLPRNPPFRSNISPVSNGVIPPLTTETLFSTAIGANTLNVLVHDYGNSYTSYWNLALERRISGNIAVSATYVGSKATKLDSLFDTNPARATADPTSPLNPRRPIPEFAGIPGAENWGFSTYHALQLRAEHRMKRGLMFVGDFTWSHSIDNVSQSTGADGDGGLADPYNRALAKGSSGFDVRHRFVLSANYELPLGKGKAFLSNAGGIAGALASGWRVGGIATLSDGRHFSVTVAQSALNNGAGGYPNLTCDPNLPGSQRDPARWFNTACFANPAPGRVGTEGRNILVGPGITNVDFTIAKETRFAEDKLLEFRAEAFNVANHPQFQLPGGAIGSTTLGVVTVANAPRQIQFGLKLLF